MHRFFAPTLDPGDEEVLLPRDEGEHLTRVLRLGPGAEVSVFDGRGREFLARVIAARRRDVRVQLLSRIEPVRESSAAITLAQAVLKGEKMDDVVRDAVMLGAHAVQPLVTTRAEVTVAALTHGARVERWRRIALASAKQCGRAVVPDIRMPLTLEHYLTEPAPAMRLMLVEPSAGVDVEPLSAIERSPAPNDVDVIVGSEGGWTDEECRTAHQHAVRLMRAGPRTLRADAVAISVLSILQYLWDR